MRLVERNELDGLVEVDGVRRTVSLMLVPEAEVGQHVLIHAGYAISTVDEEQAQETLALLRQYADAVEPL
jgi:hydrogenase expression/formation protein HypC